MRKVLENDIVPDVHKEPTTERASWFKRVFNSMFNKKQYMDIERVNIYEKINKDVWPVLYRATHELQGESTMDEDSTMKVLYLLFKNVNGIEKLNIYFFDYSDHTIDPFLAYRMENDVLVWEPLLKTPSFLKRLVDGENSRGICWSEALKSVYKFNLVPHDVIIERDSINNFTEVYGSGIIVPLILKKRLHGFIEMYGKKVRFDGDNSKEPYSLMLYAANIARALCIHLTMQTDQLTKLGMKWLFEHDLQKMISKNINKRKELCLMYIDGDNFKDVNDTYGHPAGDSVLKHIGKRITSSTRSNERNIYRIGGEEFAIISETSMENAIKIAKRIAHNISASPIHVRDTKGETQLITMTVSIGIAALDTLGIDASKEKLFDVCEMLKEKADAALYSAKKLGKNCIVIRAKKDAPLPSECTISDVVESDDPGFVHIKIK